MYRLDTLAKVLTNVAPSSDFEYEAARWVQVASAWVDMRSQKVEGELVGDKVDRVSSHTAYLRPNKIIKVGDRFEISGSHYEILGLADAGVQGSSRQEFKEAVLVEINDG